MPEPAPLGSRIDVINFAAWEPGLQAGEETPFPLSACHAYLFGSYG